MFEVYVMRNEHLEGELKDRFCAQLEVRHWPASIGPYWAWAVEPCSLWSPGPQLASARIYQSNLFISSAHPTLVLSGAQCFACPLQRFVRPCYFFKLFPMLHAFPAKAPICQY